MADLPNPSARSVGETTQVGDEPSEAPDERGGGTDDVLDAIHELSGRVGSLQAEVRTLRAQSRPLPAGGGERTGWDDPRGGSPDRLAWVSAVDAPAYRAPSVPRLLLEIVFLVAVAVAAAIAELDATAIVAVMAGAWLLVAVAEFAAARAARRRAEAVYAPLAGLNAGYPTDPSWFAPPAEGPELATGELELDDTLPPRLPPPADS
jgi:hypothetical protein